VPAKGKKEWGLERPNCTSNNLTGHLVLLEKYHGRDTSQNALTRGGGGAEMGLLLGRICVLNGRGVGEPGRDFRGDRKK